MPMSNYLRAELQDHVFGNGAYAVPANIYIALCTAAPASSDTGATITEASYTGYARVSTAAADWNAAVAATGVISNANDITFAQCTGGSSNVSHVALLDAAANGNLLYYGALTSGVTVSSSDTPEFLAGTLSVTST